MTTTNTSFVVSVVTLLFVIVTTVHHGQAIICYQCNSEYDPRCGDPFDPYSLGTVNCSFQPRLEHLKHLEPTICRKISQKNRIGCKGSGSNIGTGSSGCCWHLANCKVGQVCNAVSSYHCTSYHFDPKESPNRDFAFISPSGKNSHLKSAESQGFNLYGKTRVVRGCGYITDERDDRDCMIRSGTHDVRAFYCACTEDLCNGADPKLPSAVMITVLGIILACTII